MRIAYFVNQYPKVSHSFIRREILALERQGFEICRIALRGWDADVVDSEDVRERGVTRYVLQGGILPLLWAALKLLCFAPARFFNSLGLTLRIGRKAERALPYHLIYFLEACQVVVWLRAFRAQHVHAHFGTNSAEVVMLANSLGGPTYSFTVHGPEEFDKPQFLGIGEKIRRSAFVVAISSFGKSQLFRWVSHDHWSKVKVVHCGLESAFHELSKGTSGLARRFVCVGRLCEQKGQLLLLEAAAILSARNVDFELVLAGDGEMRPEIEQMIRKYGLGSRVRITGWISSAQVREEILAARAMVLPSFAEGLPVVIMEAMALRRPVLTTFVAGIPELVIDERTGWLFPAGSVDALVDAMAVCLETDDVKLMEMGEAGYRRVLERHDIDREAEKLGRFFREAVDGRNGAKC